MANYKYTEVVDALYASGFEAEKNNNGSHQKFVNTKTGLAVVVPKHANGMVASGTAESILDLAVLSARVGNINIASNRYKLSNNIIDYIKKQHKKIKEDFRQIIPERTRKACNLNSLEEVSNFVKKITNLARKQNCPKEEIICQI